MEIFKVVGIGIVGAVIVALLKSTKPEFSILVVLATGVVMLSILLSALSEVVSSISALVERSGLSAGLFGTVLKIVGIGYLTEYASGVVSEYSSESIAKKIQLAGKLTVFLLTLPILKELIELIGSIVS